MNLISAPQRRALRHDSEPTSSGRSSATTRCVLPACRARHRVPVAAAFFAPGRRQLLYQQPNSKLGRHRRRPKLSVRAGTELGDLVSSQDEWDETVAQKPVVVVDWMARWCRKCIYLKPKIAKLLQEEFPGLPVAFIDVNAVPGNLVYDQGIRKMPTITIYKDGQKVREHVAAEGGLKAVTAIREMLKEYQEAEGQQPDA